MKRLALLLGSLLVVTAAASAKEVVPAPVVVEEAPVQIVEKEVIVYRDKEEGFRPNGFVSLEYRYYGNTEDNKYSTDVASRNAWNDNNNYSRLQLEGKIQMTEKQAFEYRVRNFNSLSELSESGNLSDKDNTRLRYYYDHGSRMTSFVEYNNGDSKQSLEYQLKFDLADYMFNNDFVKTTTFVVGPRYIYEWSDGNDAGYKNKLGLYLDWINQLPYGFSTEVEIDGLHYTMYGDNSKISDGVNRYKKEDNDLSVSVAAKIMHDANLYTNGAYSLDWHFEGGYDTYSWSNRDKFEPVRNHTVFDDSNYELYAQPSVTLSYQATEFVNLYGTLGAEYRNWVDSNESSAQDWRWQPFAAVGFRTTF